MGCKRPTADIPLYCDTIASPWGQVVVGMTDEGLASCGFLRAADSDSLKWGGCSFRPVQAWGQCDQVLIQLEEYFAGRRQQFELSYDLRGTEFQIEVWEALLAIPYATTRSYGQLATAIGRPLSVRAVGQACGRNPVGIIVPCHRVIGADGSLTGYANGLSNKAALLELERRTAGVGALRLPGL